MKSVYRYVFPALTSLLCFPIALIAQNNFQPGQLDPTRNVVSPQPADQGHTAVAGAVHLERQSPIEGTD